MASIDSNIALSIKPAQIESPLVHAARAAELQNAQQSQFMNMLKMKEYVDESRNKNAMTQWLAGKTAADLNNDANLNHLATQFGQQGLALAKQIDDRRKAQGEAEYRQAQITDLKSQGDKRRYELGELQTKNAISTISGLRNRQQALDMLYESEVNGTIPREAAENIRRMIPDNEEEFPAFKQSLISRLVSPDKQFEAQNAKIVQDRKLMDDAYAAYVYSEKKLNPNAAVLSREEFEKQRNKSPLTSAVPTLESNVVPAAATDQNQPNRLIFAPAQAPAPAPAPAKEVPLVDPAVEATLIARGDFAELARLRQKASEERDKLNRPVYSEINLTDKVAVVKRDPATGKTTVVDSFPVGISPADKERLKNDSIKIKQENTRIGLDAKRVSLETKRVAVLEQNAAREADPAFQRKMAAARAEGEAIAKDEVKARQALPGLISRAEENIRLIDELVGKAPEIDKKTGKVIKAGTKPHPGFSDAVGATWLPGARFIDGTDAADFARRDQQIKGASFLEAFEMLKGGGSITNIEGEKGTAAINRMSLAQSEKEYIDAAREVQDILRTGMNRARTRAKVAAPSNSGVFDAADAVLRGQ